MKIQLIKGRNSQQGMSLIEVLVAALILGVALVSIAVMQMNALKAGNNSVFRSVATDIASALAARMRANTPGVIGADIGTPRSSQVGTDSYYNTTWTGACAGPPTPQCATNTVASVSCTAKEVANWDLYEATCAPDVSINAQLPANSTLTVACSAGPGFIYTDDCTITIGWTGSANVGSGPESLEINVLPGIQKIDKDPVISI